MSNYIKLNEDRWNNVKMTTPEPLTHEELEEARKASTSVALTVGEKSPQNGLKKPRERILGLASVVVAKEPVFAAKGYDVWSCGEIFPTSCN